MKLRDLLTVMPWEQRVVISAIDTDGKPWRSDYERYTYAGEILKSIPDHILDQIVKDVWFSPVFNNSIVIST